MLIKQEIMKVMKMQVKMYLNLIFLRSNSIIARMKFKLLSTAGGRNEDTSGSATFSVVALVRFKNQDRGYFIFFLTFVIFRCRKINTGLGRWP